MCYPVIWSLNISQFADVLAVKLISERFTWLGCTLPVSYELITVTSLANEASHVTKAGGPLNTNGRSEDDDLRKSSRTNERDETMARTSQDDLRQNVRANERDTASARTNEDDLRKSARINERDESSPGINDILSGTTWDKKIIFFLAELRFNTFRRPWLWILLSFCPYSSSIFFAFFNYIFSSVNYFVSYPFSFLHYFNTSPLCVFFFSVFCCSNLRVFIRYNLETDNSEQDRKRIHFEALNCLLSQAAISKINFLKNDFLKICSWHVYFFQLTYHHTLLSVFLKDSQNSVQFLLNVSIFLFLFHTCTKGRRISQLSSSL